MISIVLINNLSKVNCRNLTLCTVFCAASSKIKHNRQMILVHL